MAENISFCFSEDPETVQRIGMSFGLVAGDHPILASGQQVLMLVLRRGQDVIGCASGIYSADADSFRIFGVPMKPKEARWELAALALRNLLETARKRFGARHYEWIYDLPLHTKDAYEDFLKQLELPWLRQTSRKVLGRRARISVSALRGKNMIHNHEAFSPESFARRGFAAVPLDELSKETKEKVEGILRASTEKTAGLSPFVGAGNYDRRTSFVVIEKATGDVAGWIVCRRRGQDTEFRRWYCADRFRRQNLGIAMSALLLRIVQETDDASAPAGGLSIFMLADSPSYTGLMRMYHNYFSDAVDRETDVCRITLEDCVRCDNR